MLIRKENGELIEIKITDFLTDADYYKFLIKGLTPLKNPKK
jgi:hypothetical protein